MKERILEGINNCFFKEHSCKNCPYKKYGIECIVTLMEETKKFIEGVK